MLRLAPFLMCILLFGCSSPSSDAPTLRLTIESDGGSSRGLHRVFRPGPISASEDGDSRGNRISQRLIVDEVTDQGILLTVEVEQVADGESDDWSEQVRIPYDEKTIVQLPDNTTLTAVLERHQ